MIREDYIMRQVSMLSQIVARLLGLRRAAQHESALAEIEPTLHRLLGMSPGLVAGLAPEELLAKVRRDATAAGGRDLGALLAALLHEQGANLDALGRLPEGREFHLRALQVLLALLEEEGAASLPDSAPSLESLTVRLCGADIPPATRLALLGALEQVGAFARAEDHLFAMLAAEPGDAALGAWGEAFYDRLERRTDAELAAGDLPRAELAAGRESLRRA